MSPLICNNCGHTDTSVLNQVNSDLELVPTSDGQFISNVQAKRTICPSCSCVEIHFSPKNRLLDFFQSEYDISDSVQNNIIVLNNQGTEKHLNITNNFFENTELFRSTGNFLEIACGSGEFTKSFANKFPDWKCVGIDPSAEAPSSDEENNVQFIKDFFSTEPFESNSYDVIVAHGILNRTPTLPLLKSIAHLASKGAIVSIEFLTMEKSIFTPHIWDHSFTFMEETFNSYLKQCGLTLLKKYDCASTWQYICRYEPDEQFVPNKSSETLTRTKQHFESQLIFWENVCKKLSNNIAGSTNCGLFGAGLFSAVLLKLIAPQGIHFIVDEVRHGKVMLQTPIISLDDAEKLQDGHILLCIRPCYMKFVEKKLKTSNMDYTSLFTEEDLVALELV